MAIRQLSNVRATPQATILKASLLPAPRFSAQLVGPMEANGAAGIGRESVVRCFVRRRAPCRHWRLFR
jgi:hypothetical protein